MEEEGTPLPMLGGTGPDPRAEELKQATPGKKPAAAGPPPAPLPFPPPTAGSRNDKFAGRSLVREIDLPSRGMAYGPDGPSKARVSAISMVEEKMISGAGGSIDRRIDALLGGCLEIGIPTTDLVGGDALWAMLNIRALSYGSKYSFEFKCGECNEQYSYDVNLLEHLKVQRLHDGWQEPFEAKLPVSGMTAGLRLMRRGDEKQVEARVKELRKKMRGQGDPKMIFQMMKRIVHLDGQPVEDRDLYQFVSKMEAPDIQAIRWAVEDNDCGPDLVVDLECDGCGYEHSEVGLPITAEFFRPGRDGPVREFA